MSLTKAQRQKLLEWVAEGLRLQEINARARQDDPPWDITYSQLDHVRRSKSQRVRRIAAAAEHEALHEGLAKRARRIQEKMNRHDLLRQVIEERGQAEHMQEIEGGRTGVLVREYRGSSDLPVYKVDTAVLKELRDLEREIAIELGQWTEKRELSGPDGGPIEVAVEGLLDKIYGEEKPANIESG